jgi:plastocyanin
MLHAMRRGWIPLVAGTALAVGAVLTIGGCSDHSDSGGSQAPVALGNGVIKGKVVFEGKAPKPTFFKDTLCGTSHAKIPDESVLVNSNGTLRNVLVYLKDAPPAGDGTKRPTVLLDQIGCRYIPHVVALQTGQTLHVLNSDPTIHNVHVEGHANPASNIPMPNQDDKHDFTFSKPEIITVKCDVHPWMRSYVGVFQNPFFAVTDATGAFTIKDIPDGTYTLVAHHERFGDKEQKITIKDGKPVTVSLTFAAPTTQP